MSVPHWERCLPWIEASLGTGHQAATPDEVLSLICAGKVQFWPSDKGCVVTEIGADESARFLSYWIVGGDLAELFLLMPGIHAFARVWGCTEARFYPVRKGWERAMRPHGFEMIADYARKRIVHVH